MPSRHCLPSLHSQSALPHAPNTAYHPYARGVHSRHCLPSLRLRSALPTCSRHCLPSLHLRGALPSLLTILKLAEFPPDTSYPYASVLHP
ncbi:hypothetical protein O181_089006 [Austropuccinia psidii MF-1]|uniref:Uncharacterized protein n=1 Tax=Austropuccinia psidii MF-1 TaxID=1389203 RepID=A0A9Q3P7F5_9BASI|nr:hypothetical protein [Austropuccinia psidii MF-1]